QSRPRRPRADHPRRRGAGAPFAPPSVQQISWLRSPDATHPQGFDFLEDPGDLVAAVIAGAHETLATGPGDAFACSVMCHVVPDLVCQLFARAEELSLHSFLEQLIVLV